MPNSPTGRLVLTACEVDLAERRVHRQGRTARLTPHEAEVLRYLAARPGRVVPREELERRVWGLREGVETETVAVCVRRLRAKIERDPRHPDHLQTVHGTGWVLRLGAPTPVADHLPRWPTRFVGREELLREVAAVLASERLVTLWGPGGVGKTRLAVAAASATPSSHKWFVDLAEARTAEDVARAVGRALELSLPDTGDAAVRAVGDALAAHDQPIVVLDEADAAVDAVAACAAAWPATRLLATSRSPFGRVVRVDPMSPEDAVALYDSAAWRVDASYDPDRHRTAVRALVEALDRLPLAVELAGARADLASAHEVLARVREGRLDVLERYGPGPERHRTLSAAVAHSWDALAEEPRDVLAALTVFARPFSLEHAEAVLGAGALGALHELVRRALVHRPAQRFALHRAVAAFAAARRPPSADLLRRHAEVFVDRAETWAARAVADPEALRTLAAEVPEVTLAVDRMAAVDPGLAARGIVAIGPVVQAHASASEVCERMGRVLAAGPPAALAAELRLGRARVNVFLRDLAAVRADLDLLPDDAVTAPTRARLHLLEHRVADAEATLRPWLADEGPTRWEILTVHGNVCRQQGRSGEAFRAFRAAHALTAGTLPRAAANHLVALGTLLLLRGRPRSAERLLRRAVEALEPWSAWDQAGARLPLASALIDDGRLEEGHRVAEEAVTGLSRLGNRVAAAVAEIVVSNVEAERGELDAAIARVSRIAEEVVHDPHPLLRTEAPGWLGVYHWLAGDRDAARVHFDRALATRHGPGVTLYEAMRAAIAGLEGDVAAAHGRLEAVWRRALPQERAVCAILGLLVGWTAPRPVRVDGNAIRLARRIVELERGPISGAGRRRRRR